MNRGEGRYMSYAAAVGRAREMFAWGFCLGGVVGVLIGLVAAQASA